MSRRILALACALALLGIAMPASAAGPGPYVHDWQVEGMVGGDLGGAVRKDVGRDAMTMSLVDGAFAGVIRYEDALAIQAASGAMTAQFSSIEVTLTGTSAEGGAAAAGSFAGTATLETRPARSLDDLRDRSGDEVVYEVSGHWGAVLENGVARGELLYERATVVSAPSPTIEYKGATWFNRLSAEKDGGSQSFEVEVAGLATGTKPKSDTTPRRTSQVIGALEYVRRGVAGQPGAQAPPVPLELSKRARALKDAAPLGAVKLPTDAVAIDLDVPGAYLDAKNRAAGLLGDRGPTGQAGAALAQAWRSPVDVSVDYSSPLYGRDQELRSRIASLGGSTIPGASELASDLAAAISRRESVGPWGEVVAAVSAVRPSGSVHAATSAQADAVASARIPRTGPMADAVWVAHGDLGGLPPSAYAVLSMKQEPSIFSTTPASAFIPGLSSGAKPTTDAAGLDASVRRWNGYRRPDGTLYWLGAPGNRVALVDGTLLGAGFMVSRMYLVDASDVGRVLAVYPSR